jgi:hypothetical protein
MQRYRMPPVCVEAEALALAESWTACVSPPIPPVKAPDADVLREMIGFAAASASAHCTAEIDLDLARLHPPAALELAVPRHRGETHRVSSR